MRIGSRRLARVLFSMTVVTASLILSPGCGSSQPPTGTMAGETKEAGDSTQAQLEFMKKQEGTGKAR